MNTNNFAALLDALNSLENAATAALVVINNVRPDGQICGDLSKAIKAARAVIAKTTEEKI